MGGCISSSPGPVPPSPRAPAPTARHCLQVPHAWHSLVPQKEVHSMRDEFWSTRVEGDPNMWLALRRACEAVLSGDVVLADALLDGAGLKTTEGSISTCFDERGFAYKLPVHCFCDPVDNTTSGAAAYKADVVSVSNSVASSDAVSDEGVQNSGDFINVKVRINPGEKNATVRCSPTDPVYRIRQRVCQLDDMASAGVTVDRLRLIFMGRELKDDSQLLRDAKIDESRVLQVFIRPLR